MALVIYAKIMGGLGNQLFQYATARALALRHGVELRLDTRYYDGYQSGRWLEPFRREYLLDQLRICARPIHGVERVLLSGHYYGSRLHLPRIVNALGVGLVLPIYHEPHFQCDPHFERAGRNVYLDGYWQTERYFRDTADVIRQEFRPVDSARLEAAEREVRSLSQNGPIVSLHIRRGDVVVPGNDAGAPPYRSEYVDVARELFGSRATYLVFSDDLPWCRQNIVGERIRYADGGDPVQDLLRMSSCDHHIMAASTFSWWGAWLNPNPDKIVVAPTPWFGPRHHDKDTRDLIPAAWRQM